MIYLNQSQVLHVVSLTYISPMSNTWDFSPFYVIVCRTDSALIKKFYFGFTVTSIEI